MKQIGWLLRKPTTVLAAVVAATTVLASPAASEDKQSTALFYGIEGGPRSDFVYSGALIALNGDLGRSGFVLRGLAGAILDRRAIDAERRAGAPLRHRSVDLDRLQQLPLPGRVAMVAPLVGATMAKSFRRTTSWSISRSRLSSATSSFSRPFSSSSAFSRRISGGSYCRTACANWSRSPR